ncbi:MAG: hypothetical protein NTY82_05225 [Actinobacteria bacterium]|nr:hypothetical protein [Actinomycetota bacterium]
MTNSLLPKNPKIYAGYLVVRIITFVFLLVVVARSAVHLFSPDGGAGTIAGIDTSVAGGNNIIALFHQWGAIQLLLAGLMLVLFFAYKGFTPLVILFLCLDAPMRALAGQMGAVESTRTPPGEALNWPVFALLVVLFAISLVPKKSKPVSQG